MKRVRTWLRGVSIFVTLTLLLFVGVNLAAYLVFSAIQRKGPDVHAGDWFIAPLSPQGQAILEEVYGRRDTPLFVQLLGDDPSIRPHPVLAFTEGLSTAQYRIGLEGMRYQPGWSDQQVASWLGRKGEFIYLFGGSTAFGHGTPGDQTVTAQLNRRAGRTRFLNLAVQAYDSIREVDKLLHLLRQGHRPEGVIFLDGLNDVTTFSWSNYRAHDKPRTQGLLLDRGEVGLVFGYPRRRNMLAAFLFGLPVVQLAARLQSPPVAVSGYRLKDAATEPLNWREVFYLYDHWDLVQSLRAPALAEELVEYQRQNLEFLRRLGQAFDFWVEVVHQPIGLLDRENPFLREAFFESPVYSIYRTVDERLRREIESGNLGMADCSQALIAADGRTVYVDSTHYSPQGNELLAACLEAAAARHDARPSGSMAEQ